MERTNSGEDILLTWSRNGFFHGAGLEECWVVVDIVRDREVRRRRVVDAIVAVLGFECLVGDELVVVVVGMVGVVALKLMVGVLVWSSLTLLMSFSSRSDMEFCKWHLMLHIGSIDLTPDLCHCKMEKLNTKRDFRKLGSKEAPE